VEAVDHIRHIRRLAAALAGLAAALLVSATTAPAAFTGASLTPGPADYITPRAEPLGWHPPLLPGHIYQPVHQAPAHTVVVGGMPAWQIALIAAIARSARRRGGGSRGPGMGSAPAHRRAKRLTHRRLPSPARPGPEEVIMNRIRRTCRSLSGLPRRAGALSALAAAAPAVLATAPPLPAGWNHRPPMPLEYIFGPVVKVPGHTVVVASMPRWEIALIATGAALLTVVLAVIADTARAARRRQMAGAA
jgi:hypothetical protein